VPVLLSKWSAVLQQKLWSVERRQKLSSERQLRLSAVLVQLRTWWELQRWMWLL